MEALIVILNQEEHFNRLVPLFEEKGIYGATIIDSQGLAATFLEQADSNSFSYLRSILNQGRPYNKTILLLLENQKVDLAKSCVREAVGDLEAENVGIMFTLPVSSAEGITK